MPLKTANVFGDFLDLLSCIHPFIADYISNFGFAVEKQKLKGNLEGSQADAFYTLKSNSVSFKLNPEWRSKWPSKY